MYGVVWKSNVLVPRYGADHVGGGGLSSTVPDLARFLIAHANRGRLGDTKLLESETVDLMHAPYVMTRADLGMVASGYGWVRYQETPWQYWGTRLDFYGAQGHGGSDVGYRSRMWYVQEASGAYGVVLLTNVADFFKTDMPWLFSAWMRIESLLINDARRRWQAKHDL